MLHGHGDDWYKYKQPLRYNFSSNVWHKGPDASLLDVIRQNIGSTIGKYPSPDAAELSALACAFHQLAGEYCLFTNGATEAFYLIAQLFRNSTATIFYPTFAEYEDACQSHGIRTSYIQRNKLGAEAIHSELAFICNPNNPDGFISSSAIIEEEIKRYPATTFVIDEAYIDFATGAASCIPLLTQYPNLIVVKSLTKLFSIPGIRLGYLLSSPHLITRLKDHKMPWGVNGIAIEAGKHIFQHYVELKPELNEAVEDSKYLQQEISEIEGFSVVPANTIFFLLKSERGTAAELKDFLMQEYQLLVRDATNFRGLEGEYIRIAVQDRKGNGILLKALKRWSRQ